MPYTPPSQQSPATSRVNSPALSRSSSYSEDGPRSPAIGRPSPPRSNSASYLHKHRRSPSIKSDGGPPTPSESPEHPFAATDFAPGGSVHPSPPSSGSAVLIESGGVPSPPNSAETSDNDEATDQERGRSLGNGVEDELRQSVRGINQRRESSPEKPGVAHTGTNSEPVSQTSSPTALSVEARKISHSRSSTDLYMPSHRRDFDSPIQGSDDSDEEERPSLVRKKSGELVKPALRPSSRRRYSSMPGTPTYHKTVHFNDNDNQTRHFLQVDKPIAVSAGTSPVESHDSETEFPFNDEGKTSREIKLSNFPADTFERKTKPVRVERIFLSNDKNTLIGVCAVQNISFHKLVVARFTLDYWKTTSEVVADYNNDPKNPPIDGCDRFNFHIKLSDQANIEEKTLLLCVRYSVSGQEYWDNNDDSNYQIDFLRAPKKSTKPTMTNGLGARPLSAIPRSRHSPPSTSRDRPPSLDDDFAAGLEKNSAYSLGSPDSILGESPSSIKLKPRTKRPSVLPANGTPPTNGLGGRYDFGASLSAALSQAQEKLGHRSGLLKDAPKSSGGSYFGPIERKGGPIKAEERPDAITTDRPAMGSDQYKDLVQKFCYFTSGSGKPSATTSTADNSKPDSAKPSIGSDGADDYSASSSCTDSGTSSPLFTSLDKPASPVKNPFGPRSSSPAAVTGGGLGGRAASPISFGYPYHHNSRDGYLSDSPAPTAIHG